MDRIGLKNHLKHQIKAKHHHLQQNMKPKNLILKKMRIKIREKIVNMEKRKKMIRIKMKRINLKRGKGVEVEVEVEVEVGVEVLTEKDFHLETDDLVLDVRFHLEESH